MIRIGIAGCGRAAKIHLKRMLAREDVKVVGLADPDSAAAFELAAAVPTGEPPVPTFSDHKELLVRAEPDALAIFAPHRTHYRLAMDALQAGCHVFIERPLTTNAQEADDIVSLARGRGKLVGVGHQYRLSPSLIELKKQLSAGTIGQVRLVTATLASPWLAKHQEKADAWRLDPKLSGGGILADVGDHLLDALLWTLGEKAVEVAAFSTKLPPNLDIVTAAAIRFSDGTSGLVGISGVCGSPTFELCYYGETGRLRASDTTLLASQGHGSEESVALNRPGETIDGDFVVAVAQNSSPCCPAAEAIDTVRLLEAVTRSAGSGQVVRLA